MVSDNPFADPPWCTVCKKRHQYSEDCAYDMAKETSHLHPSKPSRRRTDDAMEFDHLTHQEDPQQTTPSKIDRRRLSPAFTEQDTTQRDHPDGATSIIVPDMPLEGDPFSPHWAIAEDAGTYNPPDAPDVDVSPKVAQNDWDHVMASIPPHQRSGLRKQDYHWFESGWLIGKPMFPHQLHDRARADLNMIDEKQGGFEPLPMPALAHDKKQWTLPAQTHTFDEVARTFEPIDEGPKRAQKKSLLTEDKMERNIMGFLKEPAKRTQRTASALPATEFIFAREA
ncbi:hypothetical protein AC578_6533 [Pseudocercospora eumusae]|uniref:Uncharacterized protein n=1 Tax=Pseudocercospora eumusae TaxID=321146 RepID=A0A139HHP5_9PEZI|nr:hypothetical protein AC578_6533 [Pseudocercospora eumusae]